MPAAELPRDIPGERAAPWAPNGTNTTTLEAIMLRRLVRIVLVMTLGTALAVAALAATAAALPTVSAELDGTAPLVAKGAAVDVGVSYSCSSDAAFADISVSLTQRVGGGRLASGSAGTSNLVCDGTEHTALVRVTAFGAAAFKKGDAAAQGFLEACLADGTCATTGFSGVLRIR
jgi:hypothetical protein